MIETGLQREVQGGGVAGSAEFGLSDFSTFRLWVDAEPRSGVANMAIDQAMLDAAEAGGTLFRIYRWEPYCLSFGRNEPALRRYDRARIESLGLDVVRRPTGGRAVWHADELTYAIAAPASILGDLRAAYRRIHEMLALAIASLGASPVLAAAPDGGIPLERGACFAAPAGGEILLPGGKVVGSAQVRQGNAMLQHGSVLLSGSQEPVQAVTDGPPPPAGDSTLSRELGRSVGFGHVAEAIIRAASPARIASGPPEGILAAAAAHELQFGSADWTWRR